MSKYKGTIIILSDDDNLNNMGLYMTKSAGLL